MQLATGHQEFDEFADPADAMATAIPNILSNSSRSSAARGRADAAAQIERLIRSGARIDAALALIALELPQWQLRRIAYDAGDWYCALSRARELPDWLDQCAEGQHADLALALLNAFIEAQRIAASSRQQRALPRPTNTACTPLCCDNFS